jgi:hypothetical protein
MERERKSFSNRGVKRKILPENNVLSMSSACLFSRFRAKSRLASIEARAAPQPGIVLKRGPWSGGFPVKIGSAQLRKPKNQPKLDESVQLD